MKTNVMGYVFTVLGIDPLPLNASKLDRGWNHNSTARLLVPQRLWDKFDKEPLAYVSPHCVSII